MELAAQDQESEQVSGLAPGVDGAGGRVQTQSGLEFGRNPEKSVQGQQGERV